VKHLLQGSFYEWRRHEAAEAMRRGLGQCDARQTTWVSTQVQAATCRRPDSVADPTITTYELIMSNYVTRQHHVISSTSDIQMDIYPQCSLLKQVEKKTKRELANSDLSGKQPLSHRFLCVCSFKIIHSLYSVLHTELSFTALWLI